MKNGAAIRVTDAAERLGVVRQQSGNGYDTSKQLPGRAAAQRGLRPHRARPRTTARRSRSSSTSSTTMYPEGKTSYNAVAEIPGHRQGRRGRDARRPPRLVALGHRRDGQRDRLRDHDGGRAHPAGDRRQAAPDDPRRAVGRRGRRTARVEGLRRAALRHRSRSRSRSSRSSTRYWNIDSGTGTRPRRQHLRTAGRRRILAQFIKPFEDLGVYGALGHGEPRRPAAPTARHSTARACRASAAARIRSSTAAFTHHTNLDTYERILPEDVKKDAVLTASIVYHIAMRDEMMPRFGKDNMPAVPAARGGGAGPLH